MMAWSRRDWDSAFFGYPVAAAEFARPPAPDEIRARLDDARRQGIRLLYLFAPPLEAAPRRACEHAGLKWMGRKVEFAKPLSSPAGPADPDLVPCREWTPALEGLALQSGEHSRFRLDAGFRNREFERLYAEWLAGSLRGDGGKRAWIAGTPSAPRGLITLEPGEALRIGLLAVDARQRGRGLGRRLVAEAERRGALQRAPELRVATQAENAGACRFYESRGFACVSQTEIFHAWLEPAARIPAPEEHP